jgi:hypothetical protein
MDSEYIGSIQIFDDCSTIDLPDEMPNEVLEMNFFTFEAKCIILDNVCPIVEKRYWKLFENH